MNFYKKYESLNDIPEPFRRTRKAEPSLLDNGESTVKEAAIQSESVKDNDKETEKNTGSTYEAQGTKQQNANVHKGNQDLVFMMLMFMLITE